MFGRRQFFFPTFWGFPLIDRTVSFSNCLSKKKGFPRTGVPTFIPVSPFAQAALADSQNTAMTRVKQKSYGFTTVTPSQEAELLRSTHVERRLLVLALVDGREEDVEGEERHGGEERDDAGEDEELRVGGKVTRRLTLARHRVAAVQVHLDRVTKTTTNRKEGTRQVNVNRVLLHIPPPPNTSSLLSILVTGSLSPERVLSGVRYVEHGGGAGLVGAGDVVLHDGGEIRAGGEGADGEEPLQDAHEPARLFQHGRLHHGGADRLRRGEGGEEEQEEKKDD